MFRIRLFCTISIFLCALYSGRAQDWESQAVAYERIIYDGAGLEETNAALLGKAECYKQLGRYADAVATLDRVRMFALTDEERANVLYQQELCHYLAGEFAQAAALVDEVEPVNRDILLLHALSLAYAGQYDKSEIMAARYLSWNGPSEHLDDLFKLYAGHPRSRNATTALVLGTLPPLGHIYNEAYGEAALSLGLNAVSVAFTAASLLGGYWITGIAGGAIALDYTWMGAQERSVELTELYNNNAPLQFGDKLRAFLSEVQ